MALAEVLTGAGVLLLILSLAALTLVAYLRGTRRLADQQYPTDRVARGLQSCGEVLASSQAVVEPSFTPVKPALPLVLKVRHERGFSTQGLAVDGDRLVLIDYAGAFDRAHPYPSEARYRTLGPATNVTFTQDEKAWRVSLQAGSGQPWQTAVPRR